REARPRKSLGFITCDLRGVKKPGGALRAAKIPRNLQISKNFRPPPRLTLSKSGTYTHAMTNRRLFVAVLAVAAGAFAATHRLDAQTRTRAMYVSALTDAGAPAADLGPSDFVVREDNVAREVLKVEPAVDPMEIAVLVDTSQAARNDISHIRTALPPFVKA